MDICEHCHNILAKSVDRCTVCGTLRDDPFAADTRRREDTSAPTNAPGWAAPAVSEGLHAEDFLRELTGEGSEEPTPPPVLPPRVETTPPTGALAGYLGRRIDGADDGSLDEPGETQPPPPTAPSLESFGVPAADDRLLTTATKLSADGVAARSTRLDGSVKLGPVPQHALLAYGAPLLAAVIVLATILMSYRVRTSEAAAEEVDQQTEIIDATAITRTSDAVIRLDLDGCGVVDQTTGFLFADQAILVLRSDAKTDDRPTVVRRDGAVHRSAIVGWSLTRDVAVVRAEERLAGGLRWGVSGRSAVGEIVSVLTVTGPGSATPVPAEITDISKLDGVLQSFEIDIEPAAGSIVLNGDGFVIGWVGSDGRIQVSDDLSPAISRLVLADERPLAECPPPPTTTTTVADDTNDPSDSDPAATE